MNIFSNEEKKVKSCPVCLSLQPKPFIKIQSLQYWTCPICEVKFLSPNHWLSRKDEYEFYLTHENDADNLGYRKFVSKLLEPLLEKLSKKTAGLDYGCGPSSALAKMFIEHGFKITLYDPFFYPAKNALNFKYDFITCSEVVEHFHHPAKEFNKLNSLLKPGGWLGIMTSFQTDDSHFENWGYRRDPTHVVFYRIKTFMVVAEQMGWSCEIPCKNIVLMNKPF